MEFRNYRTVTFVLSKFQMSFKYIAAKRLRNKPTDMYFALKYFLFPFTIQIAYSNTCLKQHDFSVPSIKLYLVFECTLKFVKSHKFQNKFKPCLLEI